MNRKTLHGFLTNYIVKPTGRVVIRSDTKPALDLIITRLRVILKIVWPYKHPFAALKKWPLDLINTHLRSSKKKSDLITAQMRKKTFCANRIFFNQKYFLTNSLGWKSVTLNPQMRQTLFAKIVFSQKSVTHTGHTQKTFFSSRKIGTFDHDWK